MTDAVVKHDVAVEERRQNLANSIKLRLAAEVISVNDARDGMRDCFIASYLGGVSQGFRMFEIRGDVDQISNVIDSMFRQRLRLQGTSWENPAPEALYRVKEELDREIHFHELPAELRSLHDQICNLLLSKAANELPHKGDRSVVTTKAAKVIGPTERAIRQSIVAYLKQMALASEKGIEVGRLIEDMGGLNHLLHALKAVTRP